MKCQRCNQREANIQVLQQIAGKKPQNLFLCEICARELGIAVPKLGNPGKLVSNPFLEMGAMFKNAQELSAASQSETTCSTCNTTFAEFKKTGLLGCPDCYHSLSRELEPLLLRTQVGQRHVGRKLAQLSTPPERLPVNKASKAKETENLIQLEAEQKKQLIELKKVQLAAAVKEENYRLAAELRDEIAGLEKET